MTDTLDSPTTDVYGGTTEVIPPPVTEIPKPELSPCPAQPCPYEPPVTVQPPKTVKHDDTGYLPNTGQSMEIILILALILVAIGATAWFMGRGE
jgi:LPXTG-motif cell wall-anchored protein